jgi:putative nucleotidyltransferase with HDIG domain
MDDTRSLDDLIKRLSAAVRTAAIYPPTHPLAQRGLAHLLTALEAQLSHLHDITIGFLGDDVIAGKVRLRASANLQGLVRQFRDLRIEKITLSRGVTREDVQRFVALVAERSDQPLAARFEASAIKGVGIGVMDTDESAPDSALGMMAARHVYEQAVHGAKDAWGEAFEGGAPDADAARTIIDILAKAVAHDRASMLVLTDTKSHDSYTFTHMVNVSILTMAQARTLGLNSATVREFGLAGLMHDIGKVKVSPDIINKPGSLTDVEREAMQRHVVEGAQILRKTPGMPALAPVVAFEHHLRLDGGGYPEGVDRRRLNLCTMLVSIADVFDALRTNRSYRSGLPTDRVRTMLAHQSGKAFESTLLRRFTTLMGLFPVGSAVRLMNGEIGIVIQEHQSDMHHPEVLVMLDPSGGRLAAPVVRDTSLSRAGSDTEIEEAVDAATWGLDPLEAFAA